ncbi:MAG: ABC transporter ATP-binding protein [Anaerolineae bacterium]|nr:ABC transporter ATP-binding protein [Anaerolineae bacterium]
MEQQQASQTVPEGQAPVLEVRNITKRFPGVLANDHINLKLYKGQVLGLLGENGAGKSTLMNLIYGMYQPDEGEILVNGHPVKIHGPKDAINQGIGMVHQHFQLVDTLTVTENVMLGNESTVGPFLNRRAARKRILEISRQYGLAVDPNALVRDLSVGVQQRVEIIKALYRRADILILDEPTAVLTPQEARGLFEIMRSLTAQGVSIIFISHKLKEVLEICDDVVVLRRGKVGGTADPKNTTQQILASIMVGRSVTLTVDKESAQPGVSVLEVRDLHVLNDRKLPAVRGLSLTVFSGQILGIAGVQGNGQSELVEALTGLRPVENGSIHLNGREISSASPRQITEAGVAHIPEDRQKMGVVGTFPITSNEVLNTYYKEPFAQTFVINEPAIERHAADLVEAYDVRTPSIFAPVQTLSGGNQQKVIVAREFSRDCRLIIAAQPTRGLDVGSIEFIHQQLVRLRDAGAAVLLVSSELDEILALSDRLVVMFSGQVIDEFSAETANREVIGLRMAGSRE